MSLLGLVGPSTLGPLTYYLALASAEKEKRAWLRFFFSAPWSTLWSYINSTQCLALIRGKGAFLFATLETALVMQRVGMEGHSA